MMKARYVPLSNISPARCPRVSRTAPAERPVEGGRQPAWNPAGGELFFLGRPEGQGPSRVRRMMVVEVQTSPALRIGVPRGLFSFPARELAFNCTPANCYSVSSDGQRFFVIRSDDALTGPPPVTHIHLIQNWLEEVKARVPTD